MQTLCLQQSASLDWKMCPHLCYVAEDGLLMQSSLPLQGGLVLLLARALAVQLLSQKALLLSHMLLSPQLLLLVMLSLLPAYVLTLPAASCMRHLQASS